MFTTALVDMAVNPSNARAPIRTDANKVVKISAAPAALTAIAPQKYAPGAPTIAKIY